ncbi:lysosome-associated membrane glycoprotein 3 [Halichoeres trimaculatus]|uniref:lysosome-associated membrane glycoprotein 3 n=1 Tax=Halichoeres trimaculatus TaxID=147232 RepID=UPI003D9FA532
MIMKTHTGGWSLFFLAAVIPGVHLQETSSHVQPVLTSEQPTETLLYQPVLQPSESIPPIGTYTLATLDGIPRIKAIMGVEYIITEKKTWYFSLDPTRVRATGYCGKETAVMSLTLPNNAGSLQFLFGKDKDNFWVSKVAAHLTPLPLCQKCSNKTYYGLVDYEKLFLTAGGKSYKCKSESVLLMSSELKIKLVPLQLQAFTLPKGGFGKEVECWADYYKRVLPIVVGAVVVCILLIAVITFLFIRDRRTEGYDRL